MPQAFASTAALHSSSSVPNPLESSLSISSSGGDEISNSGGGEVTISNNKRTALAGQWRTPPTPFFPVGDKDVVEVVSAQQQQHQQQHQQHPPPSLVTSNTTTTTANHHSHGATGPAAPQQQQQTIMTIKTEITLSAGGDETSSMITQDELPLSTEDYAKALQQAYRRGAEAAARAAAQQQLVTVASQPDLQLPPQPPPQQQQQQLLPPAQNLLAPMPTATATVGSTMAPFVGMVPLVLQPAVVVHHQQSLPEHISSSMSAPVPAAQQPTAVMTMAAAPPSTTAAAAVPNTTTTYIATQENQQQQQQQQQQRSVSMPDMASYAAQQEDEKRQKRLARNRASARLRRLRKKNLVDAYETEVVALEKTVKQLQNHQWGSSAGADPAALLEALSMDRGQQQLTAIERTETANGILHQQLAFLQQLEDVMQEHHILFEVARATANGTLDQSEWADVGNSLQLSMEQCQSLLQQSAGWDEEWHALQTIKTSLLALKENKWLWNEGCAAITDQFLAILHKNQISKFLFWADHNAEAIEELDAVHAVDQVTDSPIFQFGIDNNPNELLDDEKQSAA
jgi:hypothetical protein